MPPMSIKNKLNAVANQQVCGVICTTFPKRFMTVSEVALQLCNIKVVNIIKHYPCFARSLILTLLPQRSTT